MPVNEAEVKGAALAVETAAGLAGTLAPETAPVAVGVVAVSGAVANDPADVAQAINDGVAVLHPAAEGRLVALEALGTDIVNFLTHTFPGHFKRTA